MLKFLPALITIGALSSAFAQSGMTGVEFVTGFRELRGKTVMISDCKIGGTTESFIRCETANGSASYALPAETMNRQDYRWALENCPTGSVRKPSCQIRVQGVVNKSSGLPTLDSATIIKGVP